MPSDDPFFDAEQRADVARKVAGRRLKRRLKAAASIGLALMAGAFLACAPDKPHKQKLRVPVPPNPTTPGVGALPSHAPPPPGHSAGATSPSSTAIQPAASSASSTAIQPAAKTPHKGPSIDKQEHRKGMPVPDNLLE